MLRRFALFATLLVLPLTGKLEGQLGDGAAKGKIHLEAELQGKKVQ